MPKKLILLFIIITMLYCTGCSLKPATDNKQPTDKIQTLVVGTTMKVDGINIDDYNFGIIRALLTHKSLVKLAETGEITGDLAETFDSQDGKTWRFKIRDGLTWHDGQRLTAADVKFTIEYLRAKSIEYKSHLSLVKSIETPNEQTVIITLSQPTPRFLSNLLVLRILPQHVFANVDTPAAFNDAQAAIGCGPYIYHNFNANSGVITFKANPHYYRGQPAVQEIKIRLFRNNDSLFMALQNGEIDLPYSYSAGTDPLYAKGLAKNPRIKLLNVSNLGVSKALIFNTAKPSVNDPRVREALSYAINYQEILRLFTAGNGTSPMAGFVPPCTPGFIETKPLEFAPEKTQQLLDELGYTAGSDGLRQKDGQPLTFEIMVRNDISENMRLTELLQKYFAAVGVKVTIKAVDSTMFRTLSDKEKSHTAMLTRATPWGMMMWAGMGTGYFDARTLGWSAIADSEFRSIVNTMNSALTTDEYKQAGAKLQQYYGANLPAIPLYWDNFIQPHNASLSGFRISPMYGVLNEETWFNLRRANK